MKRLVVIVVVLGGILLLQGCAIYARPYGYGYYGGRYYGYGPYYYGYAPYYGYGLSYWSSSYYYPYYYYRPYRYYEYRPPRPRWDGGTWGGRYGGRQTFPDRSGGPGSSGRGSITPRSSGKLGGSYGGGRPGLGGRSRR